MTRKHFRMIVLAALFCVIGLAASTASLRAQNQKCCKYTVITKGISDSCYPLKVTTAWDNGAFDTFGIFSDGVEIRDVPKCPPVPSFKGVSVNGSPYVGLGQTIKWTDPNTKCCFVIDVQLDPDGCVVITITPC